MTPDPTAWTSRSSSLAAFAWGPPPSRDFALCAQQDDVSTATVVPKQHSSGGKDRLGSISKQGDRYLRGLFVAGALAVIRYAKIHGTKHWPWLTALLARGRRRSPPSHSPIRSRRMVWAMLAKGERVQGTRRTCGVNEIAPDNRRDVKVGRANST